MKNLFNKLIACRQTKANYEVAKQLHNSEYRNETFAYVLDLVNSGKLHKV